MTLSNFEWTDKDSEKWFILLPTGHEGPYSLNHLAGLAKAKKLSLKIEVWTEGLSGSLALAKALETAEKAAHALEHEVPELPPLPGEPEEVLPPLPLEEVEDEAEELEEKTPEVKSPGKFRVWAFITGAVLLMAFFAFSSLLKNQESFRVNRLPKMTLELHERILNENAFEGWNKKIFFKEYLPDDHSYIWLVTSSFQTCKVAATFESVKDKLLSVEDEKVVFKSTGELSHHLVELSAFEFSAGNKIVPGLYEMNIRATECEWEGLLTSLMNKFSGPDKEYIARTKVVLFSKGPVEFNKILDKLLQKKMAAELKAQAQEDLFWQNLQQKFETLQAVTIQVEQLMLDSLEGNPKNLKKDTSLMIDQYTRKFGSFLTSFVIDNENYFKDLKEGSSRKRNYELVVRTTAKKIGFESMTFIEEFRGLKKTPTAQDLKNYSARVRKAFAALKNEIAQKIIQVSEDRSQKP